MNLKEKAREVQAAGKGGDIHLIHVNDEELKIIKKALSHEGVVNEDTGLLSFTPTKPSQEATEGAVVPGEGGAWQARPREGDPSKGYDWWWVATALPGATVQPFQSTGTGTGSSSVSNPLPTAPAMPSFGGSGGSSGSSGSSFTDIEGTVNRIIDRNVERFPEASRTVLDVVLRDMPQLNDVMRAELTKALTYLYPGWEENLAGAATGAHDQVVAITDAFNKNVLPGAMAAADNISGQMLRNTQSMLDGDLPPGVAEEVKRNAAEISQQIGARGQASQYLMARDLGLSSLDMMMKGHELAPGAAAFAPTAYGGFAQASSMPIQSGTNLTNLLNGLMPEQASAVGLYGAGMSGVLGSSMINPGQLISSEMGARQAADQAAMNAWQFNVQRLDSYAALATNTQLALNNKPPS